MLCDGVRARGGAPRHVRRYAACGRADDGGCGHLIDTADQKRRSRERELRDSEAAEYQEVELAAALTRRDLCNYSIL